MEFMIYRTDIAYPSDQPPCDGAYRKESSTRDWFIKIETLEDLLNLMEKVSWDLIIGECGPVPTIEIYDAWRE